MKSKLLMYFESGNEVRGNNSKVCPLGGKSKQSEAGLMELSLQKGRLYLKAQGTE